MVRWKVSHGELWFIRIEPFQDELPDGANEGGMRSHRPGANHRHVQRIGEAAGFGVEIVQDLHVIGNEAEWSNDDILYALAVETLQVVEDVRFKPRLSRRPAAALKDEIPLSNSGAGGDQPACFR